LSLAPFSSSPLLKMATLAVATTYSPSSIAPLKAPCRFGFQFASFLSSTTKQKCPSITTTTLDVATQPTVSVNPDTNPNQLVLPSNESSERLLRIRHTVMGNAILLLLTSFRHQVYRNVNCIYFFKLLFNSEYKLQPIYTISYATNLS